jgi:predicted protein tyrosine phosphatase
MVDSVPRWQLSLSGPIQSDHLLIAVCDDTAFGAGTLLSTFLESRSWLWKIIIIIMQTIHKGSISKNFTTYKIKRSLQKVD